MRFGGRQGVEDMDHSRTKTKKLATEWDRGAPAQDDGGGNLTHRLSRNALSFDRGRAGRPAKGSEAIMRKDRIKAAGAPARRRCKLSLPPSRLRGWDRSRHASSARAIFLSRFAPTSDSRAHFGAFAVLLTRRASSMLMPHGTDARPLRQENYAHIYELANSNPHAGARSRRFGSCQSVSRETFWCA